MKQAKDYIIFALDVPDPDAARQCIDALSGHVGLFKVGLELFINAGPDIIRAVQSRGQAGIFLDLKLHDIPATVERAMSRVADLGVELTTVHCGESRTMLEAAVIGSGGKVDVLAVTVLTSVSEGDIREAGYDETWCADMPGLVKKRALMAQEAGCSGVICSGLEVGMVKQTAGSDFIAVTPGIRPDWDGVEAGDQRRVKTPAQAVRDGADYLVIGRPIRDAKDPRAAAIRIADEIEAAIVSVQT